MNFSEEIKKPEYDFLRTNEYLGSNIILLGLGGSYSYGTNNENSDLDIRGIATNPKNFILTGRDFEQVVETTTDTTIYSLDKIFKLFCSCNPNTIELLGLKPEHYLQLSPAGKLILDNKELFLSRNACYTFGGYANAQLRRLESKSARNNGQEKMEEYIINSMQCMMSAFRDRYHLDADNYINLRIDKSQRDDMNTEIFMDVNLTNYPVRDYAGLYAELDNVVKDYSKLGKRNMHAIAHDKIGKHMMHLVRLYLICFDILEKHEINTYRMAEHDLLMRIRNNEFLDASGIPTAEFYEMVNELEKRLKYDTEHTDLPEKPDSKKVFELLETINESVVRGDILR